MALQKTCPTCDLRNQPTSPFCASCGVSLVAVVPSEESALSTHAIADQTKKISCPNCQAENDFDSQRCIYCDHSFGKAGQGAHGSLVELVWPWGKEVLSKCLRIGRDPPAPDSLIKAIETYGYDNISRSHADLILDSPEGSVSVVDHGSTNGTFVDGIRIPPNKPTILVGGSVVRFAANLAVTIVIIRNSRVR